MGPCMRRLTCRSQGSFCEAKRSHVIESRGRCVLYLDTFGRPQLVRNCRSSRYAGKLQGTAALQDAGAFFSTLLLPQGLGVRLSSAAFIALINAGNYQVRWPDTRRSLAVVPSIRIEGTTARLRRGSGEARVKVGCRVGGKGGARIRNPRPETRNKLKYPMVQWPKFLFTKRDRLSAMRQAFGMQWENGAMNPGRMPAWKKSVLRLIRRQADFRCCQVLDSLR
jgi:hypothetical protein